MNSNFGTQSKLNRSARNRKRSRAANQRRLSSESLESRVLLAGDTLAWHNATMPMDTTGDGRVTAIDALAVINTLNSSGPQNVDVAAASPGLLDVNGNGVVSAADVLQIINHLNAAHGEGDAKVQVRLAVTAADTEDVVSSLQPSDEFALRAYVSDITPEEFGVFASYIGVDYEAGLADVNGDVQHCDDNSNVPATCRGNEYGNGTTDPSGANDVSVDGVMSEMGGFAGLSPLGSGEFLLFSIPMVAEDTAGTQTLTFSGSPAAELPIHETLVYGIGIPEPVLPEEIMFVNASVEVVGSAEPVIALDDSYAGDEDVAISVNAADGVLANDQPDSGLTAQLVTDAANGTVTLDADGSFTYEPNADYFGEDSFTYTATDGSQTSEAATVTLDIAPINDPPVAVDDAYTTTAGVSVIRLDSAEGLFANDFDVDSDGFTFTGATDGPFDGTLTVGPNGGFVYLPNAGFVGTDTFTYMIVDTEGAISEPATVTVTVNEPGGGNVAPVANDDAYSVDEDMTLTVDPAGVLLNDTDEDGDALTSTLVTPANDGVVTLNDDGSFTYVPDADFNGVDTFFYEVSDGELTDSAAVTITVNAVNDPPVAVDEEYTTSAGSQLVVDAANGVLANDSDPDGDDLTALSVRDPANGVLDLASDGSFTYTPDADFIGTDSFQYAVQDVTDVPLTRFATATIVVEPAGDLQVAFRVEVTDAVGTVIDSIDTGEAFTLSVYVDDITPTPQQGVFAAYTDVTWTPGLATVIGALEFGVNYPNGQTGSTSTQGLIDEAGAFDGLNELGPDEQLLFSVPMQATGSGTLTFATDPADDLPFGNVLLFETLNDAVPSELISYGSTSLTVMGLANPVAIDDAYDADDGVVSASAATGVLANDLGTGGELTAELVDGPTDGSLQLNDNGSFVYVADEGFIGTDTFTYQAESDGNTSNVATVTISIGEVLPGTLSGSVYFDTNNNGTFDAVEHAFGSVEVTLTGTDIFGNAVSRVTSTAVDGSYGFASVMPGDYVVTETQPAIVIDGIDSFGGAVSSLNDAHAVELASGEVLSGLNFGERGLQPAYFGNPLFMTSAFRGGVGIGIGPDGETSWFCHDSGWGTFSSVSATLSGSQVNITAVAVNGERFESSVAITDSRVRVLGNASNGYLVRLMGSSSDFGLQPSSAAAAVDAVFGS